MKRITNKLIFLFIITLLTNNLNGQCLNQILHTSGTEIVNGVNITISAEGVVDTMTTYCPQVTKPYLIGFDRFTAKSGNGGYKFEFDPPLDTITINFSGISYSGGSQEIVVLELDGIHYPLNQVGLDNNCDNLAVLTASGNITGCSNCDASGWAETNIAGPINSISVRDSVLSGEPAGSLFSIFICNDEPIYTFENIHKNLKIYPNPVRNTLYIKGSNLDKFDYYITDVFGKQLSVNIEIRNQTTEFDVSQLAKGIYFLSIEKNGLVGVKKIIVQ